MVVVQSEDVGMCVCIWKIVGLVTGWDKVIPTMWLPLSVPPSLSRVYVYVSRYYQEWKAHMAKRCECNLSLGSNDMAKKINIPVDCGLPRKVQELGMRRLWYW